MKRGLKPRPHSSSQTAAGLIRAASRLRQATRKLSIETPDLWVYNPLDYAWPVHRAYLARYGHAPKRVLFLGMNPGPFGMVQTGVPFGEVRAVRDWMRLQERIDRPSRMHPKRAVDGWDCRRSEVSGRRLWGLFARRFGAAEHFFRDHLVLNYCPLGFFDALGRNITPDRLNAAVQGLIRECCDRHLRQVVNLLNPRWVVGVGGYAEQQASRALSGLSVRIGRIAHPSPANPAANRNWEELALRQLRDLGVWEIAL